MPNKWVEFVKKWSAENNMNYMCAMTTKECKEAYLKAHPKEPKKAKKVKEVAPAPPAPDRTAVQMELVEMGKKAKDVAEKRANIQMELSEIGKKAKLKEAQKEAQKYLATKGMANKAKQMAVEKEQVREEAKEKVIASKKSALIAELRKMIEGKKLYDIGQAKTKDAIQSLSKKQGFGFSGGVYKSFGGRGAMLSPSEMIENALTVLERGGDEPRHSAFLTELVDFVKSSLDELKAKETAKAGKDTAKAEKAKTKAEKEKAKADALALARFQEAETNPALKVLTNADLMKLIGSFGRLDIKGADKKLNELWEEVYDLAIDDEIGEYLDDIGWKTGYKLGEILEDVFGSKKKWKEYFEKAPDDWEGDEGKGELLVRNFAGTDSIQNIREDLFTDKEGVNGSMMKLEPAKLFIKLNELVSEWLKNVKENETPEAKKRQEKKRKEDIKKWKTLTYPRPYDDTFTIWGLTKDGDQLIVYEDLSDPRSIIWHKTGEPISFRKDDYWNDAEAKYASKVGINRYKKAYRWDMTKEQLEKLTRDTFL